jgi:hypothetical protein
MKLIGFLFFFATSLNPGFSQEPSSVVSILQGSTNYVVSFADTLLHLKPEKFQINLEIINSEGIFVAATRNGEYYNTPLDTVWNNFEYTQDMVAAEEEENIDQDLIVGHESFKYWFYSPEKQDWYRLDTKPTRIDNNILASYTVNKIFDLDKKEYIDLNDWKDPIYLLFFQSKFDENRNVVFPLCRKRVIIDFSN